MLSRLFRSLFPVALLSSCVLSNDISLSTIHQGQTIHNVKLPLTRVLRPQPQGLLGQVLDSEVPITNSREFIYLVNIGIGDQTFPVIFDTGSSDIWVASTDCTTYECNLIPKYSKSGSSSASISDEPFTLGYLLGSVEGDIAFDSVTLGSYQVTSQTFGMANQVSNMSLGSSCSSGILGLSFPSTAAISHTSGPTFLANLFSYFPESNRFFAFKLGRQANDSNSTTPASIEDPTSMSSLTIGHLDDSIASDMSEFLFTPVSPEGADDYDYWKIPLMALTINSTIFTLPPSRIAHAKDPIAVLDSGTTLVLGPAADVKAFWDSVGEGKARKNEGTGLYDVRCEAALVVGFVLGRKGEGQKREFMVDPGDVSWAEGGSSSDGWCMGGIQANDNVNSGDWILGDVFLRNVYVVHYLANSTHPPQIGLLGMTDPTAALDAFRVERGPDMQSVSTVQIHHSVVTGTTLPRVVTIYTVSSVGGFLVGAVLTILFCSCRHAKR